MFCQQPYQFQLEAANQQPIKIYGCFSELWSHAPVWMASHCRKHTAWHPGSRLSCHVPTCSLFDLSMSGGYSKPHHRSNSSAEVHEIYTTGIDPDMAQLFAEFPALTRPSKKLHALEHATEHPIETVGLAVHAKPRCPWPEVNRRLKMESSGLCDLGIMHHSRSNWSSTATIVFLKNKNGDIRFCGDYRGLNAITKRDDYPMSCLIDATALLLGC